MKLIKKQLFLVEKWKTQVIICYYDWLCSVGLRRGFLIQCAILVRKILFYGKVLTKEVRFLDRWQGGYIPGPTVKSSLGLLRNMPLTLTLFRPGNKNNPASVFFFLLYRGLIVGRLLSGGFWPIPGRVARRFYSWQWGSIPGLVAMRFFFYSWRGGSRFRIQWCSFVIVVLSRLWSIRGTLWNSPANRDGLFLSRK